MTYLVTRTVNENSKSYWTQGSGWKFEGFFGPLWPASHSPKEYKSLKAAQKIVERYAYLGAEIEIAN